MSLTVTCDKSSDFCLYLQEDFESFYGKKKKKGEKSFYSSSEEDEEDEEDEEESGEFYSEEDGGLCVIAHADFVPQISPLTAKGEPEEGLSFSIVAHTRVCMGFKLHKNW